MPELENVAVTTETATPIPVAPDQATTETPTPVDTGKRTLRDELAVAVQAAFAKQPPRDDAGRFAPKADPASPSAELPAPVTPAAKPERPVGMPQAWGAEKSALWSALNPEQSAYITEREAQMEAFHAKHAGLGKWQEAAAENGTSLNEVLERVHTLESAMASDPSTGLITACHTIGMSAQDAVAALQGALRKLGVGGEAPLAGVQPQQPTADPRVDVLNQRLGSIERMFQDQATLKANGEVAAFFADATNEFAREAQNEIAHELRAMRAMGQQPDLKKAYERALWTRPDLREKLVAKQIAAKADEAVKAKAQAIDKARSASRSVAGSPPVAEGRSSADRPTAMRDEIAQRVRAMNGRA